MQTGINNNNQAYTPSASAREPRMPAVEERELTPERFLIMTAGALQFIVTRSWFRGLALTILGGVVVSMVVKAIQRSRRRNRPWTEKLAEKLGIDFDAREAEESIRQVRKEVDRLRKEVEDRFEDSRAAELLRH
jgi:hypothetical protein